MRANTFLRLAGHIAQHHFRWRDIPCVLKELFYKFRTALSDSHRTESTIACVAVRAEYHIAACGELFPGI